MAIMVNQENRNTKFLQKAFFSPVRQFLEAETEPILSELDAVFLSVVVKAVLN